MMDYFRESSFESITL